MHYNGTITHDSFTRNVEKKLHAMKIRIRVKITPLNNIHKRK